MGRAESGALVALKDLACLGQVIDMLVHIACVSVKKGLVRLREDNALAPAGGHSGRTG
jgi:hypothetical protein